MDYNKIVEYFAQKVDESRREEFREKAFKVENDSEAEALAKEFGIDITKEERAEAFRIAGNIELSDEALRNAAGGCENPEECEDLDCAQWGHVSPFDL